MPTRDPAKNKEYVAKHRAKKREAMGSESYKKERAEEMKGYRADKKEENKEDFLKKNREYMKEYRRRQASKEAKTQLNSKIEASKISRNLIDELFQKVLQQIPEKRKPGRPPKTK